MRLSTPYRDRFCVRERYRPRLLSYLGNDLRRVVRTCPLVSVAVSGDRYSVGYSVARVAGPHSYRPMRRELVSVTVAHLGISVSPGRS